jgi:two-component system sensor histidine kinase ResE
MIFRIQRDGIFLDYKANAASLLVVPADQIVGASISSILPDTLMATAMSCIEKALQTKEIQSLEYTLKIGDASHVFEARFKDSGEDEVTAIVREISDRARLEQMKSDFINRATHELRTPVATMLLMVNLIDGDAATAERQEYWEVLKSELSRERLLVEDLLSAGRLENDQANLHFRLIDSAEVLKQALHQVEQPAREKNVTLVLSRADDLEKIIDADENALTQVFVNLLGNAIKFTPSGGNVNIFVKSLNLGVQISIVDTGIGIPSEDLPLLFNRFFRGSNAIQQEIQGTGIGLYIVRSILEKHNGSIKVHSKLGQGSQFDIWLPVEQAQSEL